MIGINPSPSLINLKSNGQYYPIVISIKKTSPTIWRLKITHIPGKDNKKQRVKGNYIPGE